MEESDLCKQRYFLKLSRLFQATTIVLRGGDDQFLEVLGGDPVTLASPLRCFSALMYYGGGSFGDALSSLRVENHR